MSTISIGRIFELGIAITWQEAVEVAHAAGLEATASGRPLAPERCLISTEGQVALTSGGQPTGAALSSLGLLRLMLEGSSAPAELMALIGADGASTPAGASPASGSPARDLSWFVRPDGHGEIARLAARGLAANADESVRSELQRLRSATPAKPPATAEPAVKSRWARVAKAAGLGALAAVGVLALTTGIRVARSSDLWPSTFFTPASTSESSAVGGEPGALGAASSPASQLVRGVVASRPSRPGSSSAPEHGLTPPALPGGAAIEPGAFREVPISHDAAPLVPAGEEAEAWAAPIRHPLYSSADAEVTPPVLVHPQLPSEGKADSSPTTSAMEVVVDESGRVVRVRLHAGDTASLNDRMLVSAAKAWQFRPATRGGHAVPYVLRVPVTR